MTDAEVLCEKCGKSYSIGFWPFCPHEPIPSYHPFRPYVSEHISESGDPVLISSQADRWRFMRQNHCDYKGLKVGMPGCEV